MAVKVKCSCGARMMVTEEMIGTHVKCSRCGKVLIVPEKLRAKLAHAKADEDTLQLDVPTSCPMCKSPLEPGDVICLNCGYNVRTGVQQVFSGRGSQAPGAPSARLEKKPVVSRILAAIKSNVKLVVIIAALLVLGGAATLLVIRSSARKTAAPTAQTAGGPSGTVTQPVGPTVVKPPAETIIFTGYADPARECAGRLQRIGAALAAYRAAKGSYPEKLAELTPNYVKPNDAAGLCCPVYKGEADLDNCYQYVGKEVAGLNRIHLMLHDGEPRHAGGKAMALFSDWSVRPVSVEELNAVGLKKTGGSPPLWLTEAEAGLLARLQPEIRVANDRVAELEVLLDGQSAAKVRFGEECVLHSTPGKHSLVISSQDRRTQEIPLELRTAMVYRFRAPRHADLPIIRIRAYEWYARSQHLPKSEPPTGPAYDQILSGTQAPPAAPPRPTRPGPAVRNVVVGLKSEKETVAAAGREGGTAALRVDLANGLVYATIQREGMRYEGLNGGPIKVSQIQRLAEGQEIADDGSVRIFYSTPFGTVAFQEEPNMLLAESAELKYVAEPKPRESARREGHQGEKEAASPVELTASFDVEYPSLLGYCDFDAISPQIRTLGRPAVNQLLAKFDRPRAKQGNFGAASADLTSSALRPTPPDWMLVEGTHEWLQDPGHRPPPRGFLGPSMVRNVAPMLVDDNEPQTPQTAQRSARTDVVNMLGFYLGAIEASALIPLAARRDNNPETTAATLALGRVGVPLAIDDITGWWDWEGGPPGQGKSAEPPAQEEVPQMEALFGEASGFQGSASGIPAVVALAMMDSASGSVAAARREWYSMRQGRSDEGMDYPGRAALQRLLKDWPAERIAAAMRAWPNDADYWPRRNFIAALLYSENPHLDEIGLLTGCFRFEPSATVKMCRILLSKPSPKIAPGGGCARLLCRVGDGETVARLLSMARSDKPSDACAAVIALAETRDAALLAALKPTIEFALNESDPRTRADALVAWSALHRACGADMKLVVPLLQKYVDAETEEVRSAVVKELALTARTFGVECLAPALASKDKKTVIAAVGALASIGGPRADTMLGNVAASDDIEVLTEVVKAACVLKPVRMKQRLVALMEKFAADPAATPFLVPCVDALGKIGVEDVVPELQLTLKTHVLPKVRAAAATALGEIGASRSVASLSEAMADPDAEVRLAVTEALGRVRSAEGCRQLAEIAFPADGIYRAESWPALRSLVRGNSAEAYEAVFSQIGPAAPWKFWSLAHAVYSENDREKRGVFMTFMASMLKSNDKWTRALSAQAMAGMDMAEIARAALIAPDVNKAGIAGPIATVLGETRNRQDVALLNQLMKTYEPLRGTPPTVTAAEPEIRLPGQMGGTQRTPEEPAVEYAVDERLLIVKALGRIGGKEAALSVVAFSPKNPTDESLRILVEALRETAAPEAAVRLASLYLRTRSDSVKRDMIEAIAAVGYLSPQQCQRALLDAQRDPDPAIAAAAADAFDAVARQVQQRD